jgi:S1-C subfamily serine protease
MSSVRLSLVAFLGLALLLPPVPAAAGKCEMEAEECLAIMAKKFKGRGWVGLEMDVDEKTGTMTVTRVVPGSPAYSSGFQTGDVLVAVNGVKFADEDKAAMKKAQGDWKPGQRVTYTVKRNSGERRLYVTLGEMPRHVLAQWIGNHMLEYHLPAEPTEN